MFYEVWASSYRNGRHTHIYSGHMSPDSNKNAISLCSACTVLKTRTGPDRRPHEAMFPIDGKLWSKASKFRCLICGSALERIESGAGWNLKILSILDKPR